MTIATYEELKQAIQDYGKRTDALSMLDTFIDLAESDIWDVLRTEEAIATLSTGTADRFVSLPSDYLAVRSARIVISGGGWVTLTYRTPAALRLIDTAGLPCYFTVEDAIGLDRTPDVDYSLEFSYYKSLPALTAAAPTNALLTEHPFLYLSGCMKHFFVWAQNEEKAAMWQTAFNSRVARANRKARKGRYGPAPAVKVSGMVV